MDRKIFRNLALSYPRDSELLTQEFEKMLKGRKRNVVATQKFLAGYVEPISKKKSSTRSAVAAVVPTAR